jgi:hypothetical protein
VLSRQVPLKLRPQPFFAFSHFSGKVLHVCSRATSDCDPNPSQVAGMTGAHHHAQLID